MRNSVLVLTKINDYFPILRKVGNAIDKAVTTIITEDKREDLKVLATR